MDRLSAPEIPMGDKAFRFVDRYDQKVSATVKVDGFTYNLRSATCQDGNGYWICVYEKVH